MYKFYLFIDKLWFKIHISNHHAYIDNIKTLGTFIEEIILFFKHQLIDRYHFINPDSCDETAW